MLVKKGNSTLVEARAKAKPADDLIPGDYYTRLPQIRLCVDASGRYEYADTSTEVTLDDSDVARLVACAIAHPNRNMRSVALAAIWNDPEAFRELFRFGLNAPEAFSEIRKIVTEELGKVAAGAENPDKPGGAALLPRMPVPAHLRNRKA